MIGIPALADNSKVKVQAKDQDIPAYHKHTTPHQVDIWTASVAAHALRGGARQLLLLHPSAIHTTTQRIHAQETHHLLVAASEPYAGCRCYSRWNPAAPEGP